MSLYKYWCLNFIAIRGSRILHAKRSFATCGHRLRSAWYRVFAKIELLTCVVVFQYPPLYLRLFPRISSITWKFLTFNRWVIQIHTFYFFFYIILQDNGAKCSTATRWVFRIWVFFLSPFVHCESILQVTTANNEHGSIFFSEQNSLQICSLKKVNKIEKNRL